MIKCGVPSIDFSRLYGPRHERKVLFHFSHQLQSAKSVFYGRLVHTNCLCECTYREKKKNKFDNFHQVSGFWQIKVIEKRMGQRPFIFILLNRLNRNLFCSIPLIQPVRIRIFLKILYLNIGMGITV
ncbi:MAG: hypothetical protein RL335_433 [Bacteroidota bacterium]